LLAQSSFQDKFGLGPGCVRRVFIRCSSGCAWLILVYKASVANTWRRGHRAIAPPAHRSLSPAIPTLASWVVHVVVGLFHVKIDLFDDKFALLVLLACFVCPGICPAHHRLTTLAKDITYTVQSSDQQTILRWTNCNVNALIKEVGATVTAMEALGDDVVVRGQVRSALTTGVHKRPFEVDHRIIFFLSRLGSGSLGA